MVGTLESPVPPVIGIAAWEQVYISGINWVIIKAIQEKFPKQRKGKPIQIEKYTKHPIDKARKLTLSVILTLNIHKKRHSENYKRKKYYKQT